MLKCNMRVVNLFTLYLFYLITTTIIKCSEDEWWKTAIIYQIYPRSFKDTNGDGIGDLNGIISKLDHLTDIGVSALWLSPIYKSPGIDFGYDISDFREIDPLFGTIHDFKRLLTIAHEKGLKVIMDFVPNHTSDEHIWFNKSVYKETGFENYYVWRDTPNNWISYFHGSAWTYNEIRKQYYLHEFHVKQPDLNYREAAVVQEMKDILRFWLDIGIDGFRVDIIPTLFENANFQDDPICISCNCKRSDYCFGYDTFDKNQPRAFCTLSHINTLDLPESYDMLYQWREIIDEYKAILMTESYSDTPNELMLYYGNKTHNGAHFTFNFWLITQLNANSTARDFKFIIEKWFSYMPVNCTANWVLGNHDQHRVATRYGKQRVDGLNLLILTLPGVAVTYNGEEIGLENGEVNYEQGMDPQACNGEAKFFEANSRDFERTPFHWNNETNAGFTDAKQTWLPISEKYHNNNLEEQKNNGNKTHYGVYKKMAELRRNNDVFRYGDLKVLALTEFVLGHSHFRELNLQYILLINMINGTQTVDLSYFKSVPKQANFEIVIASTESKRNIGDKVDGKSLTLTPFESLQLCVKAVP